MKNKMINRDRQRILISHFNISESINMKPNVRNVTSSQLFLDQYYGHLRMVKLNGPDVIEIA